jgi:hypothetical protein
MRRASIGTVELTSAACTRAFGKPREPVPGLGVTTGNSCDGLTGATLEPGTGGSATSGGTTLDKDEDVALLAAATASVTDAEAVAPLAVADAVNATFAPSGAAVDTGTETRSGCAGVTGRMEIVQVAPLADGQIAKVGLPR